jgi:hypothetical protein
VGHNADVDRCPGHQQYTETVSHVLDLKKAKKEDEETMPNAKGGLERRETQEEQKYHQDDERIQITGAEVLLPDDLSLNAEETHVLEKLRARLRKRVDERTGEKEMESGRSSIDCTIVPSRSEESRNGSTHAHI